jgi:hypothetical protein
MDYPTNHNSKIGGDKVQVGCMSCIGQNTSDASQTCRQTNYRVKHGNGLWQFSCSYTSSDYSACYASNTGRTSKLSDYSRGEADRS